jgi:hypothetical protein
MSSRKLTKAQQKLQAAYETYLARQDRSQHPDGRCDNGGRWYPSENEQQQCCRGIRSPSRSYPWSLMTHCRTLDHVAHVCGVDPTALRAHKREVECPERERKAAEARERRAATVYYKAVAVADDGRLLSIFDGETEYRLGETLHETARPGHNGGYYVYETRTAAEDAEVPSDSALRDAPRAIIACHVAGKCIRYDWGKLAFSRVTPLEVVPTPAPTVSRCA